MVLNVSSHCRLNITHTGREEGALKPGQRSGKESEAPLPRKSRCCEDKFRFYGLGKYFTDDFPCKIKIYLKSDALFVCLGNCRHGK